MEVTTSNFEKVIPIIEQKLNHVQYIAIDLEFTGVRNEKFEKDYITALPYQKYRKMKWVAENFQILQLGLTIVTFEDGLKTYPFNIYLFPRRPSGHVQDRVLSMQLGCVLFNAEHGMDWNKWIREGVNYTTAESFAQFKNTSTADVMQKLTPQNQKAANSLIETMRDLNKADQGKSKVIKDCPLYTGTIRKLFNVCIRQSNLHLQLTVDNTPDGDIIRITKVSKEEQHRRITAADAEHFGFAVVWEQVWKKCPVFVGHNCLFDWLYLYHNLVAPLPDSYFDWKQAMTGKNRRRFYDTKYMAMQHPNIFDGGTKLENLVPTIRGKKEKLLTMDSYGVFSNYSLDKQALHEAGYDSYLTAWVYQQMTLLLGKKHRDYENHFNIIRSFFYMDLSRDQDIIEPHYADNMIRVGVEVKAQEDVRTRRYEEVGKIKDALRAFDQGHDYLIHEGYLDIFVEFRQQKIKQIEQIFKSMKDKNGLKGVKHFEAYLEWQIQRTNKNYFNRMNAANNRQKRYEAREAEVKEEKPKASEGEAKPKVQKKSQK